MAKYAQNSIFQDFFQLHTFNVMSPFFCRYHSFALGTRKKNLAYVTLLRAQLLTCVFPSVQVKINEFKILVSQACFIVV
jgi:hypothetical protein